MKVQFHTQNGRFAFVGHPLGLARHVLRLQFVGKLVLDSLLVIISLVSLRLVSVAEHSEWKSVEAGAFEAAG